MTGVGVSVGYVGGVYLLAMGAQALNPSLPANLPAILGGAVFVVAWVPFWEGQRNSSS